MKIIRPSAETYLQDEYRQLFRNLTYPERTANIRPFEMAKAAKEAGASVLAVDVRTQCYSLHETGVYVKDPWLGGRDLTQECVDACRQYGLKFIGYVAPESYEPWYERYPQWQQRKSDGKLTGMDWGGRPTPAPPVRSAISCAKNWWRSRPNTARTGSTSTACCSTARPATARTAARASSAGSAGRCRLRPIGQARTGTISSSGDTGGSLPPPNGWPTPFTRSIRGSR